MSLNIRCERIFCETNLLTMWWFLRYLLRGHQHFVKLNWTELNLNHSLNKVIHEFSHNLVVKIDKLFASCIKNQEKRRMNHQLFMKSIQMRAVIQEIGKPMMQIAKEKVPVISRSISTNARLSSHHRDFHNALPFSLRNPWLFSIKYLTVVSLGFSTPYLIVLYQLKKAL